MKLTLEFETQKEIEVFRKMLGLGMFDLVNSEPDLETIEGINEAKEAFNVYVSVFNQLVNKQMEI